MLPALPLMSQPAPPPENTSRLRPFDVGENVVIYNDLTKKWDGKGTVEGIRETGLSYLIRPDDDSAPFVRGRRLLRLDKQTSQQTPPPTTSPTRDPTVDPNDAPNPEPPSVAPKDKRVRRSRRKTRPPDRLDL